MDTDAAVSSARWLRLPPGGSAFDRDALRAALSLRDPARALCDGLRARLGAREVGLYASGREALRAALAALAERSGRREVVIPAYTCYTVPASAVAAGLAVRLVDVTAEGRIDPDALARLPLERAAAVVVCNLFGLAEPLDALRPPIEAAGAALVDDAAQALGSRDAGGAVGGRGRVGLLSFGRGKPLSGLGGGALAWCGADGPASPASPAPRRWSALARALAYGAALHPLVFARLARIPGLGIGETRFDADFRRGGIDGAAVLLAAAQLERFEAEGRRRAEVAAGLAARIGRETRFVPLLASPAAAGVYPRLGVRAPTAAARDAALRALARLGAGASPLYPDSLDRVDALRAHRCDAADQPGARDFAARLLTLPTHGRLRGARLEAVVRALAGAAA